MTKLYHFIVLQLSVSNTDITFGSFNWLSAQTNPRDAHCNYETTTILRDKQAELAITKIVADLMELQVKNHQGSHSYALFGSHIDERIFTAIAIYRAPTTRPHYKQLAESMIMGRLECTDFREGLSILQTICDASGSEGFIVSATSLLTSYAEDASDFVDLAQLLVATGKREKAAEVASNVLNASREKEYENLDGLWHRLACIGLTDVANKFEERILGTN